MAMLNQILDGSLISSERLLQAREFYSPTRTALPAELAFARWAERVAVQTELGSARELAGLSDDELALMEAEFVRCQSRPRSGRARHTVASGALLAALGGLGLALPGLAAGMGKAAYPALQMVSIGGLLIGLCVLSAGVLAAFSRLPLDLSHGTTGLYVGRLDEQHPWLYKTMSLTHNTAAEDYRQRVLRDRGPLRGVDYVMMREIVHAHESLEQTRSTRSVAEQIQLQAVPVEPNTLERRLVRVAGVPTR